MIDEAVAPGNLNPRTIPFMYRKPRHFQGIIGTAENGRPESGNGEESRLESGNGEGESRPESGRSEETDRVRNSEE